MTSDPLTFDIPALTSMEINQSLWWIAESQLLHAGINTIAVEVHTGNISDPGTSFNATLSDDMGNTYLSTGSRWSYYDEGQKAPDILVDKPVVGVAGQVQLIPSKTMLYENYPNPFNPQTTIKFDLNKRSAVKLTVYSLLGQEVALLVDQPMEAGSHSVQFNAGKLSSGIYFYRIEAGEFISNKKMILLK